MTTCYFLIQPDYSDPDTYCEFTVGNSMARARLKIYADESDLWNVISALRSEEVSDKATPPEDFTLTDEWCMNIHFCVFKRGDYKILRTTIVNDADTPAWEEYRAQIDIPMNKEEAEDFCEELEIWLKNPSCIMAWNNFR